MTDLEMTKPSEEIDITYATAQDCDVPEILAQRDRYKRERDALAKALREEQELMRAAYDGEVPVGHPRFYRIAALLATLKD